VRVRKTGRPPFFVLLTNFAKAWPTLPAPLPAPNHPQSDAFQHACAWVLAITLDIAAERCDRSEDGVARAPFGFHRACWLGQRKRFVSRSSPCCARLDTSTFLPPSGFFFCSLFSPLLNNQLSTHNKNHRLLDLCNIRCRAWGLRLQCRLDRQWHLL
jgi:hypothetical protein